MMKKDVNNTFDNIKNDDSTYNFKGKERLYIYK